MSWHRHQKSCYTHVVMAYIDTHIKTSSQPSNSKRRITHTSLSIQNSHIERIWYRKSWIQQVYFLIIFNMTWLTWGCFSPCGWNVGILNKNPRSSKKHFMLFVCWFTFTFCITKINFRVLIPQNKRHIKRMSK